MRELLQLIPRRIGVILVALCATAFALFFIGQVLSMAFEPIAKFLPVSQEDVKSAERRLELERIRIATESLLSKELERRSLNDKLTQTKVEAERQRLSLPAVPAYEGANGLERLAEIATKHLSTILAIMFAAILLPAFVNSREPWRLGMVISAAITISGTFALALGAISPTSAEMRLDVYSLTVSSTSIAVTLAIVGAVLTGFCLFMMRVPLVAENASNARAPSSPDVASSDA